MNRPVFHLALGALAAGCLTAQAQLQLSGSGYTQSFDSLDSGLPTGAASVRCQQYCLGRVPASATSRYN
ncbi:MAG: hypothetical protein HS113_20705 [Verrucomicrobiales bacterium]|nr:hypothetical protein [Verrucomicrobiales bacterium]